MLYRFPCSISASTGHRSWPPGTSLIPRTNGWHHGRRGSDGWCRRWHAQQRRPSGFVRDVVRLTQHAPQGCCTGDMDIAATLRLCRLFIGRMEVDHVFKDGNRPRLLWSTKWTTIFNSSAASFYSPQCKSTSSVKQKSSVWSALGMARDVSHKCRNEVFMQVLLTLNCNFLKNYLSCLVKCRSTYTEEWTTSDFRDIWWCPTTVLQCQTLFVQGH